MRDNQYPLPLYESIYTLPIHERKEILRGMQIENDIEWLLFRSLIFAVQTNTSDIHICSDSADKNADVKICIETPKKILNMRYIKPERDVDTRHFKNKIFSMTSTPSGGSEPARFWGRFSMKFPLAIAKELGLEVSPGEIYYYIDVRVAYTRTHDGYAFTLRILDPQRTPALEHFGLTSSILKTLKEQIRIPSGIGFVSGPTGSGKTSLAYSMIQEINDGQTSIFTVESPVELTLRGDGPIKQLSVGGELTWADAAREALRHHPHLIYIGEINDPATMSVALELANTGHLVLATIHANDASETISRAISLCEDKERDAYRLSEVFKFVIAQRLIPVYTGDRLPHIPTQQEDDWIQNNGLAAPALGIMQPTSNDVERKRPVVECILSSQEIRNIIRQPDMNCDEIYKSAASHQAHYETLAEAGMRVIEDYGSKLSVCEGKLYTKMAAKSSPGMRTRLAKAYKLSYSEVNRVIDTYLLEENSSLHVEDYFERVFGGIKCAA